MPTEQADKSENNHLPPGWYRNQSNDLQWWSGKQWGPVAPSDPLSNVRNQKGTTGFATWSLILGVLAAIVTVFSFAALSDLAPALRSTLAVTLGVAGLVLGCVGLMRKESRRHLAVNGILLSAFALCAIGPMTL